MTNKSQIAISDFQTFGACFLDFGTYLIFGIWGLFFIRYKCQKAPTFIG